MKQRYKIRSGLLHCEICIALLSCFIELNNAFDFLQLLKLPRYPKTNDISQPKESNSSVLPYICNYNRIADNSSLQSLHVLGNSTDQPCCFYINASLKLPNDCLNETDILNMTAFSNLTSSEHLAKIDMDNATHYIIFKHFINVTNFVIYHKYKEDEQQKESRLKKYLGAHKLLALFLGMAGVLACLLIIIYCIYIRQHKEDMFSHRRLYGEGFEDPVLHLDTPVDHLDFFSFRDTEITPYPTPQHKCHKKEAIESKEDYMVETSKNTSSENHLHQVIQMGTMKYP